MKLNLPNEWKFKEKYIETLQCNGFEQVIKEPTRVQKNSKTLVDHVLMKSTDVDKIQSGVIKTAITDHYSKFVIIPLFANVSFVGEKFTFFTDNGQTRTFLSKLKALFNGETLATNVEEAAEKSIKKFFRSCQLHERIHYKFGEKQTSMV